MLVILISVAHGQIGLLRNKTYNGRVSVNLFRFSFSIPFSDNGLFEYLKGHALK